MRYVIEFLSRRILSLSVFLKRVDKVLHLTFGVLQCVFQKREISDDELLHAQDSIVEVRNLIGHFSFFADSVSFHLTRFSYGNPSAPASNEQNNRKLLGDRLAFHEVVANQRAARDMWPGELV